MRLTAVGALLVVIYSAASAANRPQHQMPEGFTNLFNGKDLAGGRAQTGL